MSNENKKTNYGLTFAFNAFRLLLAVTTFISGLKASEMLGVALPFWAKILVALLMVLGIDMSLDYVLKQLLSMDGKKDDTNPMDADNAPALWHGAAVVFLIATGGTTYFSGIIIGEGAAQYVNNDEEQKQKEIARQNKTYDLAQLQKIVSEDSLLLVSMKKSWKRDTSKAIHSTRSTWNIKTWQNGSYGNYSRVESPGFFRYIDNILRVDSTHRAACSPVAARIAENKASLTGLITRNTDSEVTNRIATHNAREADIAQKLASFVWLLDVFSVIAVIVLFFLLRSVRRQSNSNFDYAAHSFVQWLMDQGSQTNNVLLSSLSTLVAAIGNLLAAMIFRLVKMLGWIEDIFTTGLNMPKLNAPGAKALGFGASQPRPSYTPPVQATQVRATQAETPVRTTFQERTEKPTQAAQEQPAAPQNSDLTAIVKGFSDLQTFLAAQSATKQAETLVRTERTDFDLLENSNENEFLHNGMSGVQAMNKGGVKSKFNLYYGRVVQTAERIEQAQVLKLSDAIKGKQRETKEIRTMQNRVAGENGLLYWRQAFLSVWSEDLLPERLSNEKESIQTIIKNYIK